MDRREQEISSPWDVVLGRSPGRKSMLELVNKAEKRTRWTGGSRKSRLHGMSCLVAHQVGKAC